MFDRILKRMWQLVRARQYVMSLHAEGGQIEPNGQVGFHHSLP
jgi:hypothetical protein